MGPFVFPMRQILWMMNFFPFNFVYFFLPLMAVWLPSPCPFVFCSSLFSYWFFFRRLIRLKMWFFVVILVLYSLLIRQDLIFPFLEIRSCQTLVWYCTIKVIGCAYTWLSLCFHRLDIKWAWYQPRNCRLFGMWHGLFLKIACDI